MWLVEFSYLSCMARFYDKSNNDYKNSNVITKFNSFLYMYKTLMCRLYNLLVLKMDLAARVQVLIEAVAFTLD